MKIIRIFSEWLWDKTHPEPCIHCKQGECYEHQTFVAADEHNETWTKK